MLSAMTQMSNPGTIFTPTSDERTIAFHQAKYEIFQLQYHHQLAYKALMQDFM